MTDSEIELTHVSLFAGIGGIDLAAEWAGFKTICFVEIDDYCQKVLKKHWPNVPIIGDIRDVTKEKIMAYASQQSRQAHQVCARGATTPICAGKSRRSGGFIPPITLITGGFPCQPVSHAGKRRGKEDDRWLWPEMLRVISEIRSTWVVAENVTGLLNMGFNDCISDLESIGYETTTFLIPACGVNAPHRRDRIFIVGHSESRGAGGIRNQSQEEGSHSCDELSGNTSGLLQQDVADTTDRGNQSSSTRSNVRRLQSEVLRKGWNPDYWAVEPELGRVAHGIPHRVDRLKCLGNAVVPQQIYLVLKAIADIERG